MEKKGTIISLIFVAIIAICAVCYIIFTGITAREYNYVQLEVNPRVEFICDNKFKVVSYRALNDDAKVILSNTQYKGTDIEDATVDFIDTCAKAGYIDVNGSNNAVNITVIDGITQALDVHIVKNINNYLTENEILCAVVENYEDRKIFDQKNENNVCCSNKYKLITTLIEYNNSFTVEELNKLSEVELIDMVTNIHSTEDFSSTKDDKELKDKLINANMEKYNKHKKSITNESQKEFNILFDKFSKEASEKYKTNYNKEYINWQNNNIS